MENTIIITRHSGAVEWLRKQGIEGEVYTHATPDVVRGKRVVGVLPLNLAAEAESVVAIDINLPPEMRGKELSAEDMDKFGARLTEYKVIKL